MRTTPPKPKPTILWEALAAAAKLPKVDGGGDAQERSAQRADRAVFVGLIDLMAHAQELIGLNKPVM